MSKVKFKQWDCIVEYATYQNNATAILLKDAEDHSPIATATSFLSKEAIGSIYKSSDQLAEDEVYIKTWSENEGMAEALIEAGIIEEPKGMVPVGPYGSIALWCKIIDPDFKK